MEHRTIFFPKNIEYIPKQKLEDILLKNDFMLKNPEYFKNPEKYYFNENRKYILNPKFIKLLDFGELESYTYEPEFLVHVWIEEDTDFTINAGVDVEDLIPKEPNSQKELGDNDLLMQLIEQLYENPNATYTDPINGKSWYIRDLDFSNYISYGKTFIIIDYCLTPRKLFMQKLNKILGIELRYSFWRF